MRVPLRALWTAVWRVTAFLCIWGALLAPAGVPLLLSLQRRHLAHSPAGQLELEAVAAPTVVLATWLSLRLIDRLPFRSAGFHGAAPFRRLAWGLVLGGGMMAAAFAGLRLLDVARVQRAFHPTGAALAMTGAAVFLNSLTQETLVRGYILQTLERAGGSFLAILVSSAVFMFLHVIAIRGAWLPALNLYLAGLLLGMAYVRTRSLWLPIGIHFGWNFVQGPLLGLTVSGHDLSTAPRFIVLKGPPLLTGGSFGPEGGIMTTAATLLGGAALLVGLRPWNRRRSTFA